MSRPALRAEPTCSMIRSLRSLILPRSLLLSQLLRGPDDVVPHVTRRPTAATQPEYAAGVISLSGVAAGAVIYVKDLQRMSTFYATCFGMSTVELDDGFCVLSAGEWDLSLVVVPAAVAATIVITDPPRRRESAPVKLAFDVAGIEGVRSTVIATGGRVDPSGAAWDFAGVRHLDGLDPEGNVVQLRERLQQQEPQLGT